MNIKTLFIDIVFWLHLPIVIVLFGLFLVPTSLWAGKITFHFWYYWSVTLIQFVWAVLVYQKLDIICPLTTLMQWLRGYPLKDKKNYGHSYNAELLKKLKLNISYKIINIIILICLAIVTVQYVWFR
jgi:hypothetical protein